MAYITFCDVKKDYHIGEVTVHALKGVNFEINEGEFVVVVGDSGAGKSTILNLLGGMDTLTSGKILVANEDISAYSEKQLAQYRYDAIGFVFQFYNLIQNLTAKENVMLVCNDEKKAIHVLNELLLNNRMDHFPSQLSGGEQQRVAIARALSKSPKLLLCDEPTGALDSVTGKQVLKLLYETARQYHMTVVLITHNAAICPMADKIIRVKNGMVTDVKVNENITPIDEIVW